MPDKPADARPHNRQMILWCALVFAATVLVRLIFLEAPCFTDDTHYLKISAEYSPELVAAARSQVYFRLGMLVPLMVLNGVFGYSVFAYYMFAIGTYLLMLCGVFWAARDTCGKTAAILAVCLAGTSALVLTRSSNVFPDVPNLALMLFSFVLFRRAVHAGATSRRWLIAAAACGFAAYLFRAPNIIWLCCLPLYELSQQRTLKKSRFFACVFLGLFVVECGYYALLVGEPLVRFSVIQRGVEGWSARMPTSTLTEYLFDPIQVFLTSWTGLLLLSGGVLGIVLAWRRRNWGLLCLAAGSTLLFLAYSYSVTSFQPLQRALPLQIRYIVSLYAILAIGAAFLLSQLFEGKVLPRWPAWGRTAAVAATLLIVVVQTAELPHTIARRGVFFGKDRFYLADRVYRDLQFGVDVEGPVYAAPLQAFQLYPALRNIPTKPFTVEKKPPAGTTVLFSRKFLKLKISRLESALPHTKREVLLKDRIATFKYYLATHDDWEYLMDTGDVVLVRVNPPPDESLTTLDLLDPQLRTESWGGPAGDPANSHEGLAEQEHGLEFHVPAQTTKAASYYTFPGPWSRPVEGLDDVFQPLCREKKVGCAVTYELSEDVTTLALTVAEYDANKSLSLKTRFLPTKKGVHSIDELMPLSDGTRSFRVAVRVMGENDTVLRFHQFDVGAVPLKKLNPALETNPGGPNTGLAASKSD